MVYSGHLAPTAVIFRYVVSAEEAWIKLNGRIQSRSGHTYLTPDVYDVSADAEDRLALPVGRPTYRIGPIASEAVTFDGLSLQRVPPQFGLAGGGWQISTNRAIPYGVTTILR